MGLALRLLILFTVSLLAGGEWTFYGPYYDEFHGYKNDGPYTYTAGTIGNNDVILTTCTYDKKGKIFNYMWILPNYTSPTGAIITHINVENLKKEDLASIHLREGGVDTTSVTFNIYTRYAHGAKFLFTIHGHNPNGDNSNIKEEDCPVEKSG